LEEIDLADEKLYSATYAGSGTFIISKPKRKRAKLRQSRVKSPQRGARK
jgi:preprotein translocase subunit YajC